jgi:phosphatidylglycerophosphate synthase
MSRRRNTAIAYTLGRLLLVPALLVAIRRSTAEAIGVVALIVFADLADGSLARWSQADSDTRRIADAVVDRVSIHAPFLLVVHMHPDLGRYYWLLLTRDVVLAGSSSFLLFSHKRFVTGDRWHKAASLSAAALGIGMLTASIGVIAVVSAITVLVNYVLLVDYLCVQAVSLRAERSNTLARQVSRDLSGLRWLFTASGTNPSELLERCRVPA